MRILLIFKAHLTDVCKSDMYFVSSFAQVKATTARDGVRLVSAADGWSKPGGTVVPAIACRQNARRSPQNAMLVLGKTTR